MLLFSNFPSLSAIFLLPRPSGVLFYRRGIGYCIPFLFEMTMMAIEERLYCSSSRRPRLGQAASPPARPPARPAPSLPHKLSVIVPLRIGLGGRPRPRLSTADCLSGQKVCERASMSESSAPVVAAAALARRARARPGHLVSYKGSATLPRDCNPTRLRRRLWDRGATDKRAPRASLGKGFAIWHFPA